MKACIGIVSYLPDKIREERLNEVKALLQDCSLYFPGVDIVIVSQNYKDYVPQSENNNIILYSYKNKLGITKARKKLREIFINSDYDYLIMLDDDNQIYGEINNNFLEVLEENPNNFVCFDWDYGQLWLFAISKNLFKLIEYPNTSAEQGYIFEDIYLSKMCKELCPNYIDSKKININRKSRKGSSTWWNNSYNLKQMVKNTNDLISKDISKLKN